MTTPPRRLAAVPDPPPDVRLRDPAGVVAAVPYLLGFAPTRSLVVVGIDPHRSVGPSLRCDWQPGGPAGTTWRLWRHLSGVLRRNGCTAALVLAYTDLDPRDLDPGWAADLLDVVLADPGEPDHLANPADPTDPTDPTDPIDPGEGDLLDVLDVLVVGPSRFRSVLCRDSTCCPDDGSPVAQADHHPVAAGFVLAGLSPAPDRESVAPEGWVSDDDRARARAAARQRAHDDHDHDGADGGGSDGGGGRTDVDLDLLARWSASLPEGPDPELAGALAAAWARRPQLRDACLAVLLPGGTAAGTSMLAPTGGVVGAGLADALDDPACAGATRVGSPVLRRMAALTTGRDRATVLAAHAWLCWVAGEGTAGGVLAERALQVDARQSLARLVLQCLSYGLGAPWTTRRRPTAARTRLRGLR